MTNKDSVLDVLVKQKAAEQSEDVLAIKKDWLESINRLYARFKDWLRDVERRKLVELKFDTIGIQEERFGSYLAPVCNIVTPSGITVRAEPKARFIVSGVGRVDFVCPPNKSILVRRRDDEWEIAELDAPRGWRFKPLTEDSFWEVLDKLLG